MIRPTNLDAEIARVLALQEKASPGPWSRKSNAWGSVVVPPGNAQGNIEFIVAAHDMANLIRALRDEIIRLRADSEELAKCRAQVATLMGEVFP